MALLWKALRVGPLAEGLSSLSDEGSLWPSRLAWNEPPLDSLSPLSPSYQYCQAHLVLLMGFTPELLEEGAYLVHLPFLVGDIWKGWALVTSLCGWQL